MLILVTYDVSTVTPAGRKRLRRVARACEDFGVRAQLSVFECEVDPGQWARLKERLLSFINPDTDSLRFYFLGSGARRIEHHGAKPALDPDAPLVL